MPVNAQTLENINNFSTISTDTPKNNNIVALYSICSKGVSGAKRGASNHNYSFTKKQIPLCRTNTL